LSHPECAARIYTFANALRRLCQADIKEKAPSPFSKMSTARCYTCHTLRPLRDFSYRCKDSTVSATSRLRHYLCVIVQRPDAKSGSGGAIYRYRCVHPRDGACPKSATIGRPQNSATHIEVYVENEYPSRLDRQRREDDTRQEVEHRVEVDIEPCEQEANDFQMDKEEAIKRLRQCVGATERHAISP
jgi:hypothetical protein